MRRQLAKLVLRRYPFYSGYWKVLFSPLGRWLAPEPTPGQVVTTRVQGGLLLDVRLDDVEGRCIDLLGEWDPRISWIVRKALRPGDTFVDIGGNFGLVSLVGAKAVGPTGHAHSFEPQPDLAAMLRKSAGMNGLSQLTVHEVALSDTDGVLTLRVPEGHSGSASLIREGETAPNGDGSGHSVRVQVHKGAEYFQAKGIGQARVMKIDVEGHEDAVLAGLEPVFRDQPPAVVIFESNDWFTGLNEGKQSTDFPFADLPTVRFLSDHGYVFYAVARSLLSVKLLKIEGGTNRHPPVSDILAVHQSKLSELAPVLGLSEARV